MSFELGGPGGLLNKPGDKTQPNTAGDCKNCKSCNNHKNASQVLEVLDAVPVDGEPEEQQEALSPTDQLQKCVLLGSLPRCQAFIASLEVEMNSKIGNAPAGAAAAAAAQAREMFLRGVFASRTKGGHTLTHWAAQSGSVPVLEWVLENGSPLSVQSDDKTGMHPLHWAATRGHVEVAHMLLEKGSSINCRDKSGCTPLLIAAQYGHPLLVSYLMQRGADANLHDREGDSALHWAAYKGNAELVALFSGLGLSLKAQDNFGQAPIHLAALRGNTHAVDELLAQADERGETKAMLFLKDQDGKTPLTLAKGKKHLHLVSKIRTAESGWHWSRPMDIYGWMADAKRAPYYFVIFQMILAVVAFPLSLLSCPSTTTNVTLLSVGVIASLAMYIMGYLCTFTDPGTLKSDGPAHQAYLRTVQELSASGSVTALVGKRLCHATQMELPLRAKYCKELKAVVEEFDHYCPFVYNAIGRRNYHYFFWYIHAHLVCTSLEAYFAYSTIQSCGGTYFRWFLLADSIIFALFGLALVSTHIFLTAKWLTTNEQVNSARYAYMQDEQGRFLNPFDKGVVSNCLERAFNLRTSQADEESVKLMGANHA